MDSINERPLFRTVKKYGSSKLFLKAICFTFIGALLTFAYSIYNAVGLLSLIFSGAEDVNYSVGEISVSIAEYLISFAFAGVAFYGLFRTYRYYNGKSDRRNGLDIAVVAIGISLVYECGRFGITMFREYTDPQALLVGILLLAAVAFLCVLFIKGMRLSIEYPKNAENDSPRGQVSGFIIAVLITMVLIYLAYLAVQLFLAIRVLYTPAAEGMEAERAQKIADSIDSLIQIIVYSPSVFSYMLYLKLIRLFRREMNEAREEWAEIERRNKRSGV